MYPQKKGSLKYPKLNKNLNISKETLLSLVIGYIRNAEHCLNLSMNVPVSIIEIIYEFHPVLTFRFGKFKQDAFKIDRYSMKLEGGDPNRDDGQRQYGFSFYSDLHQCEANIIYADLMNYDNSGLNQGVHFWSVKAIFDKGAKVTCYGSIGVTTEKNYKTINDTYRSYSNWIGKGYNSHYSGVGEWKRHHILTVKLDCNKHTVTYYDNNKPIQRDDTAPNKSYYFAMICCNNSRGSKYEIVDTPKELLSY